MNYRFFGLILIAITLSTNLAYAESCSRNTDCAVGEFCGPDVEKPMIVEECSFWIFCDSYKIYPLICKTIPERRAASESEEILVVCMNDIDIVRGFCKKLRYIFDPDSIQDLWDEWADRLIPNRP